MLITRSCASVGGGKDVEGEGEDVDLMGVLVAGRGARERGGSGEEGWRLKLTLSAEALAMMCPTLFLRLLKKAARLEKT